MSLDKSINNGREKRKQYKGSKLIDHTCRNHGTCKYCRDNRLYKFKIKEQIAKDKINEEMFKEDNE